MVLPIKTLQAVGLTSSIFLAGTYFSSSHLTVPILYRIPTATSTSFFTEFYHRGAVTVVPMAIVSGICFGTVAYLVPSQRATYIAAAVATLSTLPFTLIALAETNKRLIALDESATEREKAGDEEVIRLLKKWRSLTYVRAGLALAGGLIVLV